jgi:hypothetical protein
MPLSVQTCRRTRAMQPTAADVERCVRARARGDSLECSSAMQQCRGCGGGALAALALAVASSATAAAPLVMLSPSWVYRCGSVSGVASRCNLFDKSLLWPLTQRVAGDQRHPADVSAVARVNVQSTDSPRCFHSELADERWKAALSSSTIAAVAVAATVAAVNARVCRPARRDHACDACGHTGRRQQRRCVWSRVSHATLTCRLCRGHAAWRRRRI